MSSGHSKLENSEGADGQLPPPAQEHVQEEACAESGLLKSGTGTGEDSLGAAAAASSGSGQNLPSPSGGGGVEETGRRDYNLYFTDLDFSLAPTPERADGPGISRLPVQNVTSPPSIGATALILANLYHLRLSLDEAGVGGLARHSLTATTDPPVSVPVPVVSSSHVPDSPQTQLHPNELHGLNSFLRREEEKPSGAPGILVGLGRSVLLEIIRRESDVPEGVRPSGQGATEGWEGSRATLVVCSRSALEDYWEKELKGNCPKSDVLKFHGDHRREAARLLEASEIAAHDVVITTYDVVKYALFPEARSRAAQDLADNTMARSQLLTINWHRVVLDVDEGQKIKIKDPAGKYCKSVCAL